MMLTYSNNQYVLSKADANRVLDLIQACLSCTTVDRFQQLMASLQYLVGSEHSQCVRVHFDQYPVKGLGAFSIATHFPDAWVDRYSQNDYFMKDAVVLALQNQLKLYFWGEAQNSFGSEQTAIVADEAASVGLKDGWIYALSPTSNAACAMISLAGEKMEDTPRARAILNHVLPHLAEALHRIFRTPGNTYPRLTKREIEVLTWLAEGKTAWEISVIVNISHRTVQFHVNNIVAKLGASNARHAVAIAAAEGFIRP